MESSEQRYWHEGGGEERRASEGGNTQGVDGTARPEGLASGKPTNQAGDGGEGGAKMAGERGAGDGGMPENGLETVDGAQVPQRSIRDGKAPNKNRQG